MMVSDPNTDPTPGSVFGVTPELVRTLLPGSRLSDDPRPGGADISSDDVIAWIRLVEDQVTATIRGWQELSQDRVELVAGSGKTTVALGAAYYWEAARTQPSNRHSGPSYAQDLEDRYTASLKALGELVSGWIIDPGTDSTGGIVSAFQPPIFADGWRF